MSSLYFWENVQRRLRFSAPSGLRGGWFGGKTEPALILFLMFLLLSSLLLQSLILKAIAGELIKATGPDLIAITGARVLTATGQNYDQGTILIKDGKILDIGPSLKIPPEARVIDASGCLVTPGLFDAHSHLGLGPSGGVTEDNEMTDPVTPQLRIIDSIHPEGLGPDRNQFLNAVAEGVTAALVHPGSGNVIGGQSAVLKLRGKTVDEMCLKFPAVMKMALGRKGAYAQKGQMPMTKMGTAYLVRQAMLEAAEYKKSLESYEKEKKKNPAAPAPPRDLKKEAMLLVLDRKIPVHIHVGSADDIMTAVRLAGEFGFRQLSLAHAEEAYKVAEELARNKVTVVVGPRMITYDDQNRPVNLADYLHRHGVEICIMTDADVVQQPFLRAQAAIAVRHGLDPEVALKAITINPARLVGLESRLGSLEKGKDADLVVWSGDLFDVRQQALRVFIDGQEVFRNPQLSGD